MRDFQLEKFHVDLIATDLSSQFMTHLTTSIYIGLLVASPYILYELFRFVSPALYDNERRYSVRAILAVYFLFIIGVLVSYFLLFPISFRFLGTYSVAERIHNTITLDSYVSTFTTITLLMGVVFQLPVIAFVLGKLSIVNAAQLARYRKHAFLVIMTVAAIITPGQDILTLSLVTLPLYLLYEISIRVVKRTRARKMNKSANYTCITSRRTATWSIVEAWDGGYDVRQGGRVSRCIALGPSHDTIFLGCAFRNFQVRIQEKAGVSRSSRRNKLAGFDCF